MKNVGFEHLHVHTEAGSLLDGYGRPEEYANRAKKNNQKYLCITDHGMMSAIPRQIRTCEENNLIPIYGCELYCNPLQPEIPRGETLKKYTKDMSPEEKKAFSRSYHLLAIAYNNTGYKNLVKLVSWAWLHGFYYKPRVNHEQLIKYKEGIIFTSCCYMSEVGQAFDRGGEEAGFEMIEKYMAMFGENYLLEIMLLDFKKQKPYDAFILKAHDKYHIPIIITGDVHYSEKEESDMQRLMLMIQTKKTIAQIQEKQRQSEEDGTEDVFELQDRNLWLKSEDELNQKWQESYSDVIDYDLFETAKLNTVKVCEKAAGIELDRTIKLPKFPDANEELLDLVFQGFKRRGLPQNKVYLNRIKEELALIYDKEFSEYFLIKKMMVDEARRVFNKIMGWGDGSCAVGPGRGSAGASLLCYCLGITDIDPIKHDLLFSRFLSPARGGKSRKLRFPADAELLKE